MIKKLLSSKFKKDLSFNYIIQTMNIRNHNHIVKRTSYMKLSINTLLFSLLMIAMTFFSYFLIFKIPLYIFVLVFIYMVLFANNNIKIIYKQEEFNFILYILLFSILILFQYILIGNTALLFSAASFLSGLGIVLALRYGVVTIKSMLFLVELFIIFQAVIGLIAIIQAFTGYLYPPHLGVGANSFTGLWNRPSGIEGMTYNFAKNYIFPTVFTFIALKYKLYKYSTFFTKKNLQLFLGYFIFIVILSKTRSTQLALFSLYLAYFFYTKKLYKFKYIIFGISIILILFIFVITHLDLFLDTSSKTRFILWYAGLQMFLEHPFMGVGMGLFGEYYRNMHISLLWIGDDYDHRVAAPHNIFVSLLSGSGIIGTYLIVSAFYKILKYIKQFYFKDIRLKIITLAIFYYFIAYLIDFQFHNYWNDNYFWFWIGMAMAAININDKILIRKYQ